MHYQSQGMHKIDYPGEYELDWLTVHCIADSEWLLNHIVTIGERHIAYGQNSKLIIKSSFSEVTDWLCDRDDVIAALEKLDETGKIHDVRIQW